MKNIKEIYLKYREIINYVIVGALTTFVGLASYFICIEFFLDSKNAIELQIANVISWVLAVLFAYVTNRKFVFKVKNKNIIKEFIKFVSSRLITLFLDMLIMFIMVTILGINDKISKLFVQVVVMILNYIFSKIFVFKKKEKLINIE